MQARTFFTLMQFFLKNFEFSVIDTDAKN